MEVTTTEGREMSGAKGERMSRRKRPAGLDAPELPPTRAEIAEELEIVAGIMQRTGERMAYLGGFGEIGDHGREMIGAAEIAKGWVKELRKRRRKQ